MPVITAKAPHITTLCGGMITLKRYYVGDSPDEVGSVAEWSDILWTLYTAMPFPDLWRGLTVIGWHMDHPLLDEQTRQNILNLQDYSTEAGYQVASGLFWNRERLELGFFPANWRPEDGPQVRPITAEQRAACLSALDHESGHFHAFACGAFQTGTLIQRELTRLFRAYKPAQAENEHECWAEVFRAFFGAPGRRGFFSDNKPYPASGAPQLYTLMTCAYWLQSWLNGVDFTDLQVAGSWPDRLMWQRWKVGWWGVRTSEGWFSVDRTWRQSKWDGANWIPV
jgi:hypothetical protein